MPDTELVAVIGRRAFQAPLDNALDYVAGFAIALWKQVKSLEFAPKAAFVAKTSSGQSWTKALGRRLRDGHRGGVAGWRGAGRSAGVPLLMTIVGGIGTILGPVVGAVAVYYLLTKQWQEYQTLSVVIEGILLILIVRFAPRGLWPRHFIDVSIGLGQVICVPGGRRPPNGTGR